MIDLNVRCTWTDYVASDDSSATTVYKNIKLGSRKKTDSLKIHPSEHTSSLNRRWVDAAPALRNITEKTVIPTVSLHRSNDCVDVHRVLRPVLRDEARGG